MLIVAKLPTLSVNHGRCAIILLLRPVTHRFHCSCFRSCCHRDEAGKHPPLSTAKKHANVKTTHRYHTQPFSYLCFFENLRLKLQAEKKTKQNKKFPRRLESTLSSRYGRQHALEGKDAIGNSEYFWANFELIHKLRKPKWWSWTSFAHS